jgi:pimeloyl-ACP methyl ester carboxylesterase
MTAEVVAEAPGQVVDAFFFDQSVGRIVGELVRRVIFVDQRGQGESPGRIRSGCAGPWRPGGCSASYGRCEVGAWSGLCRRCQGLARGCRVFACILCPRH